MKSGLAHRVELNKLMSSSKQYDLNHIRSEFPVLSRRVNGKPLVYLDNAATSQKPECVIESLSNYYRSYNSNIHRGIHTLSEEATAAYEAVREKIKDFIGAADSKEIIFTRNTTESINLVVSSWGKQFIRPGDEIVISPMEHHSNLVPWQQLAQNQGARLVYLEMDEQGHIDLNAARKLISKRTKLVAVTQMSNVLGTTTPVAELSQIAHEQGALILVDGAQGVPHLPTSIQNLGCDFLAFSFHKMLGPTGVGVLWGKAEILETMPPFLYGGDMISSVWRDHTNWNELPWKFEAGTPNIADVIACGPAIDYLNNLGMDNIRAHEIELTGYALNKLKTIEDLTTYGPSDPMEKGGVISFNLKGVHPHDIGQVLNEQGVAIRAGHHCCQPLMRDLGVQGTARASFYIYNTLAEVDMFVEALQQARKVMGHAAC